MFYYFIFQLKLCENFYTMLYKSVIFNLNFYVEHKMFFSFQQKSCIFCCSLPETFMNKITVDEISWSSVALQQRAGVHLS